MGDCFGSFDTYDFKLIPVPLVKDSFSDRKLVRRNRRRNGFDVDVSQSILHC